MHTKADPGVLVGDSAHCSFSTFNFISLDTKPPPDHGNTSPPAHSDHTRTQRPVSPSHHPTYTFKTIASEAVQCHHGVQGRAEEGESWVAVMDHHASDLG